MEYKDYYRTLGVARTASAAEIKKAFRSLARAHHPDLKPGDAAAEARFKEINEAYEVLGDAEKRRQYDLLGANWEQVSRAGGGPFGGPFGGVGGFGGAGGVGGFGSAGPGGIRYEFRTSGDASGFSDFFRTFFGGAGGGTSIEDLLAGLGGAPSGAERARRGGSGRAAPAGGSGRSVREPLEAPTELTLEEAFHGTTRLLELEGHRYEVSIPRGIATGGRVRLSGKGPGGRDVVVLVTVRPHAVYARRGADLEMELPITLREALLGGEVPVTTLKGRVLLTIPDGTQPGRTFRLAGRGMPRVGAEGAGNLYVKVRVVLPTALDLAATAAASRFLDLVAQADPRSA